MKQLNTQKGFTLVELAIVMTIIGLLIGGILKGQELMQNARVTSTIAQVRAYEAATTTFRDKYDSIPGDMANAQNRIPGCNANCAPLAASAGNSIIGAANWGAGTNYASQATAAVTAPPNAEAHETQLYWAHMLLADLISGVTNAAINNQTPALGETHPSAKIGGGFVVGFADGTVPPGAPAGTGPAGMVLALVQGPATNLSNAAGVQPLTPTRAAQIDRKMDDGRPAGGFVQAYGVQASCYSDQAPFSAASRGYLESSTANDCGLVFRIQG